MRTEEFKGDGGHGLQICPLNLQRNLASLVNWYILLHLKKVTRKVTGEVLRVSYLVRRF